MVNARRVSAPGRGAFRLLVWGLWLGVLAGPTPAAGVRTWVVGGAAHPWPGAGELHAADATSEVGWIQPIRITPDQNLARGDAYRVPAAYSLQPSIQSLGGLERMIDGDPTTAFQMTLEATVGSSVILDLGAILPVSLVQFYPRQSEPYQDRFLRAYQVYVTDRSLSPQGQILWDMVAPNWDNTQSVVRVAVANRYVRDVRIQALTNLQWEIAEWEVYGQGYAPSATFVSHPIDLGGPANFGALSWAVTQDAGAGISVSTRSGTDPTPYTYYRLLRPEEGLIDTVEVDRATYDKLAESDRHIVFDRANWSPWSAPYVASGSVATSPAPRRYFQLQIQFHSSVFTDRAKVDSIALQYSSPPVAQRVIGEVWPGMVEAGQLAEFTYAVVPELRPGDTGFDALRIATPLAVEVREVRIDGVPVSFVPDVSDKEATIRFPRIARNGARLEVVFACRVLVYGTVFSGTVFDSRTDELPQEVVEGNAHPDLPTNRLSVGIATLDDRVLANVEPVPAAFSPNGDSINDEVSIHYCLQKLLSPNRVVLVVTDLAGRRVWEHAAFQDSGLYAIRWDGRAQSGERVPPGTYVFTLTVHTAAGRQHAAGVVSVVY